MKKNILNEVNKIREMMGLINEQDEQESGCIEGDCENGTGTYVESNNNWRYEGEWKDGKRDGYGTFVVSNGSSYEGEWKVGKKNGYGTLVASNGSSYEGYWKNDIKNGEGRLHLPNGNVLEGTWFNNKKDGEFSCYIASTGEFRDQIWREDKLISGSSCDENSQNDSGSQGDNTFPENWKEGINNKGWVLMKGSHGHEGKIPDTKKAIEFIQTKVGLSGDDVDGLYGSNTAKKVWNYQENNGLKPDGKVGKNTLAKMLS